MSTPPDWTYPDWTSDKYHEERRKTIGKIRKLLPQLVPDPNLLPDYVKNQILPGPLNRLERFLYFSANSFEEYRDANTLEHRLKQAITRQWHPRLKLFIDCLQEATEEGGVSQTEEGGGGKRLTSGSDHGKRTKKQKNDTGTPTIPPPPNPALSQDYWQGHNLHEPHGCTEEQALSIFLLVLGLMKDNISEVPLLYILRDWNSKKVQEAVKLLVAKQLLEDSSENGHTYHLLTARGKAFFNAEKLTTTPKVCTFVLKWIHHKGIALQIIQALSGGEALNLEKIGEKRKELFAPEGKTKMTTSWQAFRTTDSVRDAFFELRLCRIVEKGEDGLGWKLGSIGLPILKKSGSHHTTPVKPLPSISDICILDLDDDSIMKRSLSPLVKARDEGKNIIINNFDSLYHFECKGGAAMSGYRCLQLVLTCAIPQLPDIWKHKFKGVPIKTTNSLFAIPTMAHLRELMGSSNDGGLNPVLVADLMVRWGIGVGLVKFECEKSPLSALLLPSFLRRYFVYGITTGGMAFTNAEATFACGELDFQEHLDRWIIPTPNNRRQALALPLLLLWKEGKVMRGVTVVGIEMATNHATSSFPWGDWSFLVLDPQKTAGQLKTVQDYRLPWREMMNKDCYLLFLGQKPLMTSEAQKRTLEAAKTAARQGPALVRVMCCCCFVEEACTILQPCGHMRTCEKCVEQLMSRKQPCPMCRKDIEGVIKLGGTSDVVAEVEAEAEF